MRSSDQINRFEKYALSHSAFLLNYARKLTGNETYAEDLFQDTYFKAFRSFDRFNGGSRCRAWLMKIMMNTYINMYNRKQKVIFYQQNDDYFKQIPCDAVEPESDFNPLYHEEFLRDSVSDEVKNSLMLLPESHRIVVIMFDMLGLTYKDIAEQTSAPMGTIKSRLFRGRVALRRNLKYFFSDKYGALKKSA